MTTETLPFAEVWPTFARRTGLVFLPGPAGTGPVSGMFEGYPFVLAARGRHRRAPGSIDITVTVTNQADLYLVLNHGLLTGLGKLLGARSGGSGDRLFDRQFQLKGDPKPLVTATLRDPTLRRELLRLAWMGSLRLKIVRQQIHLEQFDRGMAQVRHLEERFRTLRRLAATVDGLEA